MHRSSLKSGAKKNQKSPNDISPIKIKKTKKTLITQKRTITRNPNHSKVPKFTDTPLKKSSGSANQPPKPFSKLFGAASTDPKPVSTKTASSSPSSSHATKQPQQHQQQSASQPNSSQSSQSNAKARSKFAAPQKIIHIPEVNPSTPPNSSTTRITPKLKRSQSTRIYDTEIDEDEHHIDDNDNDNNGGTTTSHQEERKLILRPDQKLRNQLLYTNPDFYPVLLSLSTQGASVRSSINNQTDGDSTLDLNIINSQQKEIQNSVRVSTLKNGIKIVTAADKNSKYTSLTLSIDMGPQYEEPEAPLPSYDEDKPPPRFKGITGAYAHILNNILQNPNSDQEFKEARRQKRKRKQLLKEMIQRIGPDKMTEDLYKSVMSTKFPTEAEKAAEEHAAGDNLLSSEFSRYSTPLATTAAAVLPTKIQEKSQIKKTWRQQLRDGSLPHTKWYVQPHDEHVTISAFTTDDKIIKILKTLSLLLIHPDFNEEDYKLCMFNLQHYWDFKLDETAQAIRSGQPIEQIPDFEALSAISQNMLKKGSFPKKSSHRGPFQPLHTVMNKYDHITISKWHRLFFHSQNDPEFSTKFPLTIAITGVNSDNDHSNIITMCEQLFGGLFTRNEPFIKPRMGAGVNKNKTKTGAFVSGEINAAVEAATSQTNRDDGNNNDIEQKGETIVRGSNITPLIKRQQRYDKDNHFSPLLWESNIYSDDYHSRYEGRMPSMALTWEDTSEMSLMQYATQPLLNQTSFQARVHLKNNKNQQQNQEKSIDDAGNSQNQKKSFQSHIIPGAFTATKFIPRNAGFTHTPIHSMIMKHLFKVYAPALGLPLGINDKSNLNIKGGLSKDVLSRSISRSPRTIVPFVNPMTNTGIFSLGMTLSRSKHATEIRKAFMSDVMPNISSNLSEDRLTEAKEATIKELLQNQELFPKYLGSMTEPTMGSYPSDPVSNKFSFFGEEMLKYPKDLARQTQLFNTYLTPTMIQKVNDITLDEMKDVFDGVFKGSTRHDPPRIQALPPVHPGIVLLGIKNDLYGLEMRIGQMRRQGVPENEIRQVMDQVKSIRLLRHAQGQHQLDQLDEQARDAELKRQYEQESAKMQQEGDWDPGMGMGGP